MKYRPLLNIQSLFSQPFNKNPPCVRSHHRACAHCALFCLNRLCLCPRSVLHRASSHHSFSVLPHPHLHQRFPDHAIVYHHYTVKTPLRAALSQRILPSKKLNPSGSASMRSAARTKKPTKLLSPANHVASARSIGCRSRVTTVAQCLFNVRAASRAM